MTEALDSVLGYPHATRTSSPGSGRVGMMEMCKIAIRVIPEWVCRGSNINWILAYS